MFFSKLSYLSMFIFIIFGCTSSDLYAQQKKATDLPNLLANGKFENGTEGWTVFSEEQQKIEYSDQLEAYGLTDNNIGAKFVELDEQSAIAQKIELKKGEVYTLGYAFSHRPNAGNKQFIIQVNGKAIHTETIKNSEEPGNFKYAKIDFEAPDDVVEIVLLAVSITGDATKGVLMTEIALVPKEDSMELDLRIRG